MQYTESVVDCLKGIAQEHPESIDWQSACEQVKDPRRKQGQRFSITSILLLALAAILSNHLSELAIAEWGAGQSDEIKKALGCGKRGDSPSNHDPTPLSQSECGRGRKRISPYFSPHREQQDGETRRGCGVY